MWSSPFHAPSPKTSTQVSERSVVAERRQSREFVPIASGKRFAVDVGPPSDILPPYFYERLAMGWVIDSPTVPSVGQRWTLFSSLPTGGSLLMRPAPFQSLSLIEGEI